MKSKTIITSVKLPEQIEHQMLKRVIEDGFGMRGKSKWLLHAVEVFLGLPNYIELVNIANEMDKLHKVVSVRFPSYLMDRLDSALVKVRQQHPEMEGVKSNIIRASIMQSLLRAPSKRTSLD